MSRRWSETVSALGSELEDFDRFMTAQRIDGEETESLSGKEFRRIENILEKPVPDSIIQMRLLEKHINH